MTDLPPKISIEKLNSMTAKHEKIVMLTVYDYPSAVIAEEAQIDIAFVGDSLAMLVLGHDSTVAVTMDEMLVFMKAVSKGARTPLLLGDMPFGSFLEPELAVYNASRILKEGRMDAVKLEGGAGISDVVSAIARRDIPVMGHIGLTPQTSGAHGGFKVQGRRASQAERLLDDALALEKAGAFAIVLELVPIEVAEVISRRLTIPTIGIGSGLACDGQVLVWHDVLGQSVSPYGRHVRQYANIHSVTLSAVRAYCQDVRAGEFPSERETWHMKPDEATSFASNVGADVEPVGAHS
jgi:3-methyl-2-oxobutanoate hydroxymethyltransferase